MTIRKYNITLIFGRATNVELIKPPGMILKYLSLLYPEKVSCELVSYRNGNYEYYDDNKAHYDLKLIDSKSKLNRKLSLSLLKYLIKNAKKIDILILFHMDWESYFLSIVYKIFKSKGILYLVLDNDGSIKEFFESPNRKGIKRILGNVRPFKKIILKGVIENCEFISIELINIYEYLRSKNLKKLNDKLLLIPFGIDTFNLDRCNYISSNIKENMIITVGRIGTFQKNSEMLLSALNLIDDFKNWKVYFIGKIYNNFLEKATSFIKEHSHLDNKVFFTGELNDRNQLYDYYRRAKVFCLTSRYEGYVTVLLEAMYFGNYILSSNIITANELVSKKEIGKIINNEKELSVGLMKIINDNEHSFLHSSRISEYCRNNYSWEKIIRELALKIGIHS